MRLECKAGDALDAIETHILQGYSGVRPAVDRHLAAACPPPAAYFEEISEILECPVSTVKSRLYTALEILKAELAPIKARGVS